MCSHDGLRLHTECVRRHMNEAVDLYNTFEEVVKMCESLLCNKTMLEFANRVSLIWNYEIRFERW